MNSDERFDLFEESFRLINQGRMAEIALSAQGKHEDAATAKVYARNLRV